MNPRVEPRRAEREARVVVIEQPRAGCRVGRVASQDAIFDFVEREHEAAYPIRNHAEERRDLHDRLADSEREDAVDREHVVEVDPKRDACGVAGHFGKVDRLQ